MKRLLRYHSRLRSWWRAIRFWWQRCVRGWDDSETWSLDWKLADWLAPRLRRYRELSNGYPGNTSEEEWDAMLEEMIWAVEWRRDNAWNGENTEEFKRACKGWELLVERLDDLWW